MKASLQSLLKIRGVKTALEICVIILISLALKAWLQRSMIEGVPPLIQGTTLSGQPFDMQALKGKPLLVHFWASWCGVCKLEQDSIEAISKDHTIITIAMKSGTADEVRHYMQQHQLSFPVINDPEGKITYHFGVRAVPASFIINPAGEIAFREIGYTTNWGLRLRLWLAK